MNYESHYDDTSANAVSLSGGVLATARRETVVTVNPER